MSFAWFLKIYAILAIVYIAKANSFFEFAIGLVVSAVYASLAI